jgi:hypothetical protein
LKSEEKLSKSYFKIAIFFVLISGVSYVTHVSLSEVPFLFRCVIEACGEKFENRKLLSHHVSMRHETELGSAGGDQVLTGSRVQAPSKVMITSDQSVSFSYDNKIIKPF